MILQKTWWLPVLALLLSLPLMARWIRGPVENRCALDGSVIDPRYQVEVTDSAGNVQQFCCASCAEVWLKRHHDLPRDIIATDETSGQCIPAASAWYVRSQVVTNRVIGCRLHIFRSGSDAVKHAAAFGGRVLSEDEKPFHRIPAGGQASCCDCP
jgi:hypothetical protein